jgi:cytochrome c-type biogenesis protein CcmH/NrfG
MQRGETGDRIEVVRAGDLMGLAFAGQRPFADAIDAFERLRDANPPVPTVFLSPGKLYAKADRPLDAIAAYRRFLEIVPADNGQRAQVQSEIARLQALEPPAVPSAG